MSERHESYNIQKISMELINSFSNNETRLLVISNEIVQITFKLHNESDTSLYAENNELQDEIKQVIIAFVKFMDEDYIVDGEGYYLLCKKSIWNFGKTCVFYKNDQVIPSHHYKYNFELEFASQVINRGKNKSITDSNKTVLREVTLDDHFGMPKSSNNAINQEMMQCATVGANTSPFESWNTRQPFENRSMSRFVENTPTRQQWATQRSADNVYTVTPFDNRGRMQKPVDSAYATLFNYRGSVQKSMNNTYITPIDSRGQKSALTQKSSRNLFSLDSIDGTSRNPISVEETFEQASRTSSMRLSQEYSIRGNRPSLETTMSSDSELQKASGISKSQFQTSTRQITYDSDSNNIFDDGGESSMDNHSLSERDNSPNRIVRFLRHIIGSIV